MRDDTAFKLTYFFGRQGAIGLVSALLRSVYVCTARGVPDTRVCVRASKHNTTRCRCVAHLSVLPCLCLTSGRCDRPFGVSAGRTKRPGGDLGSALQHSRTSALPPCHSLLYLNPRLQQLVEGPPAAVREGVFVFVRVLLWHQDEESGGETQARGAAGAAAGARKKKGQ